MRQVSECRGDVSGYLGDPLRSLTRLAISTCSALNNEEAGDASSVAHIPKALLKTALSITETFSLTLYPLYLVRRKFAKDLTLLKEFTRDTAPLQGCGFYSMGLEN